MNTVQHASGVDDSDGRRNDLQVGVETHHDEGRPWDPPLPVLQDDEGRPWDPPLPVLQDPVMPGITVVHLRHITGPALESLVARARISGVGRVDSKTAELMGLELEPSTWQSRATHLKAMCAFLEKRGLDFPLSERDLLAFLGYSYDSLLTRSGPQLSSKSMAAYLSGIRLSHAALGLGLLPRARDSLFLGAAMAGYKKAASMNLSISMVRIALPVDALYDILAYALRPNAAALDVRDGALVVTAAIFGLRPAGAQGLRREHVCISESQVAVLVESLKGRTHEQARRRGERSFYAPPLVIELPCTVLQLLSRWTELRGATPGKWFSRPGLPAANLDAAVRRLVRVVGFSAPPGCQVSGHSLRILAFSQSALMLWSDVRLQIRFDWKNISDMAEVYLDHRSRTSAASRVFFCPDLPGHHSIGAAAAEARVADDGGDSEGDDSSASFATAEGNDDTQLRLQLRPESPSEGGNGSLGS